MFCVSQPLTTLLRFFSYRSSLLIMVLNGIRNPITWIYFNPLSMMTVLVIFGTLTFLMLLDFMQRPLLLKKVRSEEVGESLFQTTLNLFFMNRGGYNDKTQKYISVVEPGNNKIKHILVNESKLTKHVLNITDEAIERLYASKWKRSANVTTFPIPSFDNRYKMKCSVTCSTENAPFFIYIVQTATQHFLRRSIIRKTWGNKHFFQTNTFEIVFMLGKPANENMQILLEQEQYVHNDLVQGTFLDTYRNLTHKSVLVLRWFTENCPRVKFLVRVDDDVFVNTFYLIELLTKKYYDVKRKLIGDTIKKGPIQRTSGKWIVNKNEFKNLTHYPFPYTNGPFGIVTGDMSQSCLLLQSLYHSFG